MCRPPERSLTQTISGGNDEHCEDCGREMEMGDTIFVNSYDIKYCFGCGETIDLKEVEEIEAYYEKWD